MPVWRRAQMERWIQMHDQMGERDRALEVARVRELFLWVAGGGGAALAAQWQRYQATRSAGALAAMVPLVFGVAYMADWAYGSKLQRIRGERRVALTFCAILSLDKYTRSC